MPKKEEILEKNSELNNKEKISKKVTVLDESKKAQKTKTDKKAKSEVAKKDSVKKNTKSATKKDSTKSKETAKKEPKTKETVKKTTTKTTTKSTTKKANKKEASTKENKKTTKKENKIVEKANVEIKVDEVSVIEKIKSFIAKIAAMQEEARKEAQEENEELESKQTKKSKTAKKAKTEKEVKKFEYMLEYYDLPYRYNETVVKILAQTPKRMFVYWDISDSDREKYIKTFGENFFEKTYPVLLLYNEDKKYIREIAINDFANSWYIDIPDPKTKYSIQLGRKFKEYNELVTVNMQKVQENKIILHTDYLPFANSNILEVPNDRVLLDSMPRFVTFRNVKTNEERIVELKDIKNIYGIYDVKEFYEEHYKDEISEGMFDMSNPSSNLSSSSFK